MKPGSRRNAAALAMKERRYNQKRACALAGIDPRVYRRVSKRPADTELRGRLKELSSERRRFGYRRLHILLKREGWHVNWKKLYRIYREERLTVLKRGGRKRALGTRTPMAIPHGLNQRWSLDFVSDSLSCGRRFRILNVMMTSAGNVWPLLSTLHCPANVSPANWIGLLKSGVIRVRWSATTGPN